MRKRKVYRLALFAIFCVAAMLLGVCFSGCSSEEKPVEYGLIEKGGKLTLVLPGSDGAVKLPVRRMTADELSGYKIIRPDMAEPALLDTAKSVRHSLGEVVELMIETDWVKRGEAVPSDTREILIGGTNRTESAVGRYRKDDYFIAFENGRLAIGGGSDEAIAKASELFLEYFTDTQNNAILVPDGEKYVFTGKYRYDSISLNGIELSEYMIEDKTYNELSKSMSETLGLLNGRKFADEAEHKIIIENTLDEDSLTIEAKNGNVMLNGKRGTSPYTAVRFLFSQILKDNGDSMNKAASLNINDTIKYNPEDSAKSEPIFVWVAQNGNDTADGSENAPLATIEGARLKVREIAATTLAPITVNIRGGEYQLTETVKFTEEDSGVSGAPITYRAYNGEKVLIHGAVKVDSSLITKADSSIASRVIDKTAADKLMQIDLSGLIDEYTYSFDGSNTEIFVDGKPLERSRFPNKERYGGYQFTVSSTPNPDGTVALKYNDETAERIKLWSPEAKKNLLMFGYLKSTWMAAGYDASRLDTDARTVTLVGGSNADQFKSLQSASETNKRFYFFNLPEEIDLPGESYIDPETKIAYFYPEDGAELNNIYLSVLTVPMLSFENTEHIVLDGLTFNYSKSGCITASAVNDFKLTSCDIGLTSSNAATLDGTNILIDHCHIHDTARGGISLKGGDRVKLISSNNVVSNCEIHRLDRMEFSYSAGLSISSVGTLVKNNKFYDSVHEMIQVYTNDVIFEYNEFHDLVTEASDMGAIYYGANPSYLGMVFRYNYFHEIGNRFAGYGTHSIYIDDAATGAEIYGNIFENSPSYAIKMNSGQFSMMTGNIFVGYNAFYNNSAHGDRTDGGQNSWFKALYNSTHNINKSLKAVDFDSEIWREHYDGTIWAQLYDCVDSKRMEEYASLTVDELNEIANEYAPIKSNILSGNVIIDCGIVSGENCTAKDNYTTEDRSVFNNGKLTDSALTEIRKVIPDFEQIPFEKIGLQ